MTNTSSKELVTTITTGPARTTRRSLLVRERNLARAVTPPSHGSVSVHTAHRAAARGCLHSSAQPKLQSVHLDRGRGKHPGQSPPGARGPEFFPDGPGAACPIHRAARIGITMIGRRTLPRRPGVPAELRTALARPVAPAPPRWVSPVAGVSRNLDQRPPPHCFQSATHPASAQPPNAVHRHGRSQESPYTRHVHRPARSRKVGSDHPPERELLMQRFSAAAHTRGAAR